MTNRPASSVVRLGTWPLHSRWYSGSSRLSSSRSGDCEKNNTSINTDKKKAVVCRYFEVPLNNILILKENRNAKYNHSQLQCEYSINKRGRKQVKMYQLKIQWQEPASISLSWGLCSTTPGERMASIYQYWGTGEGNPFKKECSHMVIVWTNFTVQSPLIYMYIYTVWKEEICA